MNEEDNKKSEAALREEKVLEFWRENKIFEKSLSEREGKKEFVFYEGPPTANGKPGLHHLEARAFKDAIPRYKTMQGYHVRRKAGWDTHGLAVEIQTEKKLGLNSKKAIEEYGVAKFNQECKESVWEYVDLWNKFTDRIGYWVDQEHPYVTYHNDYIESVWNILKKVDDQKLLYKDYKVVPWCPRCGTALSSHELAQGYEDVKDLSITAKFKVKGQENTYLLAWTTTPWTLPGNVALAVGKDIEYLKLKITGIVGDTPNENLRLNGDIVYLAKSRLDILKPIVIQYEILEELKGKDLVGMEYEPLFPYLKENLPASEKSKLDKAFKVYIADFVNTEDGTGIVHTAIMYGQDDFEMGTKAGLPKYHTVDESGHFVKGTGFLEGRYVKETNPDGKPTLAVDIIEELKKQNLFYKKENYEHSYPHCWRCHTALIYYARDSWYIRMSDPSIKKKMIAENKSINWEPEHTREGRFGEWLKEIKDWAISRERYWGTPLPVWECTKCHKRDVVGSLEELRKKAKKSGNTYFMARHGEAQSNVNGTLNCKIDNKNILTEKGSRDVKRNAKRYKGFDYIFSSPLPRTRETAGLIAEVAGFDKSKIIFDDRLWELNIGDLDGKSCDEYLVYTKNMSDYFETPFPNGESRQSVHKRMGEFIYELEKKYQNKKILIVSHGDPTMALGVVASGFTKENLKEKENSFKYFSTGEIREFEFAPLPHNENFELDLHRPFIDDIDLVCTHSTSSGQACGEDTKRVKEVMDVWFDSGAMPFAQDHYPFTKESRELIDKGFFSPAKGYPADYISEAIDQTRGWFYTLHALGVLMGRGKAYKNVICLGHLLDAKGKKMSKSIGNVVNPWEVIEKYGVDTLRLWMYSVNQPGESKNFDEKTVMELHRQVFGLLYNVLAFYELYRDKDLEKEDNINSKNILDRWILAKLNELIKLSTENLDSYKLLEPTRAIKEFIGDLSTWYLRRSRERIKEGDKEAKQTLYFVLKTMATIMAPFAPFGAEDIWLKLKNETDADSAHLAKWPTAEKVDQDVLNEMQKVLDYCAVGNMLRKKSNIPVKQPLAKFFVPILPPKEYQEIIKEELNVKSIQKGEGDVVSFDTEITSELKQEGDYREFVRAVQDMRKKMGLTPSEAITLSVETSEAGKNLVQKFEADLVKVALASKIEFSGNDGEEVKAGDLVFKVKIDKI